jgi:hypothetical protein
LTRFIAAFAAGGFEFRHLLVWVKLFQFSLGPAALAFIGAGSKEDVLVARRMIDQIGDRWTVEWLRLRGLHDWAEYLHKLCGEGEAEMPLAHLVSAKSVPFRHVNGRAHSQEVQR